MLSFTTPAGGPASQTVDFPVLPPLVVGVPATAATPTATSSLPVTVASSTPAVCSVSGLTITPLAVGTCTLTADQPGDATWAAAGRCSGPRP